MSKAESLIRKIETCNRRIARLRADLNDQFSPPVLIMKPPGLAGAVFRRKQYVLQQVEVKRTKLKRELMQLLGGD